MMKKQIIFKIIVLLLLTLRCYSNSRPTSITILIPDLKDSSMLVTIYQSQPSEIGHIAKKFEQKIVKGRCKIDLDIPNLTNVGIQIGGKTLFDFPLPMIPIEPGDNLEVVVQDFNKSALLDVIFEGTGSGKLQFLQKAWHPYMKRDASARPPFNSTFRTQLYDTMNMGDKIDSAMTANRKLISPETYKILAAQTHDWFFETMIDLLTLKLKQDGVMELYKEFLERRIGLQKTLSDPDVFPLLEYPHRNLRNFALLDYGARENIKVDKIPFDNLALYSTIIKSYYKDYPYVRDLLLAERFVSELGRRGCADDIESEIQKFLSELGKGELHDKLDKIYREEKQLAKGKAFYNFELENNKGDLVRLSDFKGKNVLIDFNFNGCGACQVLVPTLKNIEEKYKDENIVFLSISVDRTRELWKKGQGIYSTPTATHLFTNGTGPDNPVIRESGIQSYPTLYLLDKEGKIIDGKFPPKLEEIVFRIDKAIKMK